MKLKYFILPFIFILLLIPLSAFEWPVDEVVMKNTFGEKSGRDFNTGITLGGPRQAVHSADFGEIVFYYNEDEEFLPSGLGNFIVVEHPRSLYSIYSHLESGYFGSPGGYELTPEDTLGWVGNTGDATGLQLNLEIVDLEFDQMVNPLNLLPPKSDKSAPVVDGVWIFEDEWKVLEDGQSLLPGERELFVSVWDQSVELPYFRPMAPYKLNVFTNGEEIFYQAFEAVEAKEGVLYLVSKQDYRSFSNLYNDEGYIRIGSYTFNPGETILEVVASDYRGNKEFYNISIKVSAQ
ncbi:MAG: M23 family metallopeptidase [Spirochaetales bacterium]|nr:M23 family metallopeptidase [Spirochaetales bacterium]